MTFFACKLCDATAEHVRQIEQHLLDEHDLEAYAKDRELSLGRFREIRKRVLCQGDCLGRTEHVHLRPNSVGRDVWRCTGCGEKRAGPILTKSDVEQSLAADGGGR